MAPALVSISTAARIEQLGNPGPTASTAQLPVVAAADRGRAEGPIRRLEVSAGSVDAAATTPAVARQAVAAAVPVAGEAKVVSALQETKTNLFNS